MKRAIVVGFDYYARYLAGLMNERSQSWRLQAFPSSRIGTIRALSAMRKADAVISFGGPGPNVALAELADSRGLPVMVIWAGTDVVIAKSSPFELAVTKASGFDHISDGPWLVDELRECGVNSIYLPVTAVRAVERAAPFPERFRVLTYLPEPRRAFYGERRVYAIARAMPDVEFAVIGTGTRNPEAPPNVKFLGYIGDVAGEIDRSVALLRLPEHDGKSMLVLETLSRSRHVVWTHAFPGVTEVLDENDALGALRALRSAFESGRLPLNETGRLFVTDTFSRERIARNFEAHLDETTARWKARPKPKHRVAMSGLNLFCAQVAEQIQCWRPEWKANILRTGSRLEVLTAMYRLLSSDVWYSIGSPITDRWVHLFARALGKARVIHWVGTDIDHFRKVPSLRNAFSSKTARHLTEADWTANELRDLGLPSTIAPLPLRHYGSNVKALPARFTILLYIPKGRPQFYGSEVYKEILAPFAGQNIRVYVVGGGTFEAPAGIDVVNVGWCDDLRRLYEDSTVLVRLTPRDGLSLMVLEALSFGRYVVWSQSFPHVYEARDKERLSEGLRDLFERHRRGDLQPQYAAAAMVARDYGPQRTTDRIVDAFVEARR